MLTFTIMLLVIVSGAVLAIQSSINGRLGAATGVLEASWLTFTVGAALSFLLVFFFEPAQSVTLFTAPKWLLIGALFGVAYMVTTVFAVPRLGMAGTTVAVIAGQLSMSLTVDHFGWLGNEMRPLDPARVIAMLLLGGALVLIYLGNKRLEKADVPHAHEPQTFGNVLDS